MPLLEGLQSRQFLTWSRLGGGTRVLRARRGLAEFSIDWAALDRRRRAELAKLDIIQQYAYTKGCRRHFVLRYFGDPAARSACAGCDNCLGTRAAPSARPASTTRKPRSARVPGTGVGRRDDDLTLDRGGTAVLARLKVLRAEIARADRVPAYVVFPDRTLAEMAARLPRSRLSLSEISGVGPARLDKYGDRFLALLREARTSE